MKTFIGILVLLFLSDQLTVAKQFKNDDNYPFSFNPDYVAPSARFSFYGRSGLVNTTKKHKDKRFTPDREWKLLRSAIAQRKVQRVKIVDSDFASVVGSDFYQRNGLVSVSRKYRVRRKGIDLQIPLIYGRDLTEGKFQKFATAKPILPLPINKIELEKPMMPRRDTQEVVSPRQ